MAIQLREPPAEDTQTELVQGKNRLRDPDQQARDGDMKGLVARWEEAGKPAPITREDGTLAPNPASPAQRYTVPKADVAAIKYQVRRAARLYKVDTAWFDNLPSDDGWVTVKFTPAPLPVKVETNGGGADNPGGGEVAGDQATDTQDQETPSGEEPGTEEQRRGRFARR